MKLLLGPSLVSVPSLHFFFYWIHIGFLQSPCLYFQKGFEPTFLIRMSHLLKKTKLVQIRFTSSLPTHKKQGFQSFYDECVLVLVPESTQGDRKEEDDGVEGDGAVSQQGGNQRKREYAEDKAHEG